jgi:aryl-alcohol dehydrogenase-like predicted oxidoreductase
LVTSVLFGATTPAQVAANVAALRVASRLTPGDADRLRTVGWPLGRAPA